MISVSIGPLSLPTAPLLLLVAVGLAGWLAARLGTHDADRRAGTARRSGPGTVVLHALYVGLAAARLGHLLLNADLYASEPLTILDLRDGGWHLASGLIAALGWILWRAWRTPGWRTGLLAGTALGATIWSTGLVLLDRLAPNGWPDVILTELEGGRQVRLADVAADRPLVLNLWASWCGPCRREMPVLAQAARRHTDVVFVFANQGEPAERVRAYLRSEGLSLAVVLLDDAGRLGPAVGSRGLPTTLVYDARGRRTAAHLGQVSAPGLSAMVRSAGAR